MLVRPESGAVTIRCCRQTDAYVSEYVRRSIGGETPGAREATPPVPALLTLHLSAERRPLLLSAYRAARRRAAGTGFSRL